MRHIFPAIIVVLATTLSFGTAATTASLPTLVRIPGGTFEMGDHHNFVDPSHPSDEVPIHTVRLTSFHMGKTDVTVQQYCDYLNSALSQGLIRVESGLVYAVGGSDLFFQTRQADQYSRIGYSGGIFSVLDNRGDHPVTSVLWHGAAAYCNWLSAQSGYQASYNTSTWQSDFSKSGYRLPTEAEWEYAARGGQTNPYFIFPWGDTADLARANFPSSGDPFEAGSYPWTTPVGFYNGQLRRKADFGWPGSQETYQTLDGANSFGLYDMAGNVWQWCNDWYGQSYYSLSPSVDPTGPTTGTSMPDGKPCHVLRGGNWYNGDSSDPGHARVANRDPAYYRGPQDPNHPYYHVGFRVVRREMAASTVTQTVGLFINDARAWDGYTLFAPKHYGSTYLINNKGRVVHTWSGSRYEPGQSVYLLENGHLLRSCMVKGQLSSGGGEGGRIEEYDWNGNLVWQFDYATSQYTQHHDIKPLPNGNILMLVVEKKTYDEAIAAGFDPSKFQSQIQQQGYMLPDSVVEIQPTMPSGGTVVWSWHVWDHLIQDYSASKNNYGNVAAHPELVNPAADGGQIPSFWNHMNALYYNAAFDQIILSVRGNSEAWVIDHSTTTAQAAGHTGGRYGKGGDLLYRWGNPIMYKAGTKNDQKYFQQHDVQWIDEGRPGAGNILAFNNGLGRNYSTADEFTPPVDANGNYALTAGAAYGPKDFTWSYEANPPSALYADAISSAQRLPNANTLICDGTHGTFLEVTPAGETVWKYVSPVVLTGPLAQGATIPADPARSGEFMNGVFRVRRYAPDYVGLAGRDLTPGGTVELQGYSHDLYFPHVASDGTWETEIAIINTGDDQTLHGVLKAYTNDGRPLDSVAISLVPHGRRELIVGQELAWPATTGYLVFESDSENTVGYIKFYIPGRVRTAIPAASMVNTGDVYVAHIASDDYWWTGISLVNTTSASKKIEIQFDNGQARTITLGALEHSAFLVRSLFENKPRPDIHSAMLKNADGVIGLEIYSGAEHLSAIPISSALATAVYYPHLASDAVWWTGILAYNPSATPCDLIITPYNVDGLPLTWISHPVAAGERYIGITTTLNVPASAVWLKIEATTPVLGFELFGAFHGNQLAGFSGTQLRSRTGVFAKKERDGWTGIAMVNLELDPATITMTAYDDAGTIVATQIHNLGAHTRIAKNAQEFFLQDISGATYLTYVSDRDLAGFQLNGSTDGRLLDALPAK